MCPGLLRQHPPSRRPLDQPLLQQKRLNNLFNRIPAFAQRRTDCIDANRPASIVFGNEKQVAAIRTIKPKIVHPKPRKCTICKGFCDNTIAFNQGKIHHPTQKPPSDPRRPARATRNLARATIMRRHTQLIGITRDNLVELILGIKLQPRWDAKPVPKRRGQQTQSRRRPNQGKGLQFNPNRPRRRSLPDHQIKFKVLHRRIEHLFYRRVKAMNFIDKKNIPCFKVREDCSKVSGFSEHGT
mmetsp:Transcript_30695/g.60262  ORF Transcript_30695/g.60262 Transcript_30695/m.60262 type:complete len:241 (+) Transcript_30695:701-1423(+)